MYQKSLLYSIAFLTTLYSGQIIAHAEHDKSRYVDSAGKDTGKCDNPIRPCQTIHYAVQQASKGDKVLVASGQYNIQDESDIFYLQSQLVPVSGGYNKFDHFQVQSPDVNQTTLTGVPVSMADQLYKAGFKVITDKKAGVISKSLANKLKKYQMLSQKQQDVACIAGSASEFPCNNVDLVAHVPLSSGTSGNDIWGHVDLNTHIEYAIMGVSNGVKVYSLETPTSPKEVGFISGSNTSWRDIKVYQYFNKLTHSYQAYAYVTSESNDGIKIIDLNNLPNSVSLATTNRTEASAHNVYINNVDYTLNTQLPNATATVQIVGAKSYGGAFTSFSLTDPKNISRLFTPSTNSRANYTHDATSFLIDDERKNRDCQTATEFCNILVDFNETEIRFWDITNTNQVTELSSIGYDDVAIENQYVHSGWFSDDKRYIFAHDEYDEFQGGLNTTVRVFDISDLKQPVLAGMYKGPTKAIDHNGFVRGNRYYMSNYERGLTILDISDATNPKDVGFFDSFPTSDNKSFNGAWGVYPYLPSGLILLSDINSGLYVLKDNTRINNEQGNISFANSTIATPRDLSLTISVNLDKASEVSTSIAYETLPGSAEENTEYTPVKGILSWEEQESGDKSFNIAIAPSNMSSPLQQSFYIRLYDPKNGATLGDHQYLTVNLAGSSHNGNITFIANKASIAENQQNFSIDIARTAGSFGSISADYQVITGSASDSDFTPISGTLTWADGDTTNKQLVVDITDDQLSENDEFFEIHLSNPINSLIEQTKYKVTILDDENNQAPTVFAGNDIELSTNASIINTEANATDAENDQLSYLWTQESGPQITIDNSTSIKPKLTSSDEAGEAIITFTVTDERGASNSDNITIKVIAAVTPPEPTTQPEPQQSSSGSIYILCILMAFVTRLRYLTVKTKSTS